MFRSPSELDESVMRFLKVPKGVIRSIVGFVAVMPVWNALSLPNFADKTIVSIKRYVFNDSQSIYGVIFLLVQQ